MQYENAHIGRVVNLTKQLIIRREGEYLNVIMIENDIHPWLKVV